MEIHKKLWCFIHQIYLKTSPHPVKQHYPKKKKTKNIISIGVDFELSKILSIDNSMNEQWCFDQALRIY